MRAASVGNWEVVVYFYSALHYVQEALLCDPIWQDVGRLAAADPRLRAKDKHVAKHQGYDRPDGSHVFGLQELTAVLYPPVTLGFASLYNASLAIRYGKGTYNPTFAGFMRTHADMIKSQAEMGMIKA